MSKYAHIKVTNEKKQSLIDALNNLSDDVLFNFDDNETRNNIVLKLQNLSDEDLKLTPSELAIMQYVASDIGIKGVGFDLHDGSDYDGPYDLMRLGKVDREGVEMIRHYKESPLVQKAINDMEKYLNEKHGKVQEAEQTVEVKQEVSETPVKKESVSVESNREQNKELAKGGKGELKKSVLQSLKEFQARAKAQEQKNKEAEKTKAHKKGDVEL